MRATEEIMSNGLRGMASVLLLAVTLTALPEARASTVTAGAVAGGSETSVGASHVGAYSSAASLLGSAAGETLVQSVLYSGNTLFSSVSFSRVELDIPSAGQLDVLLRDLNFPTGSAGLLSFALVDGTTVLGMISGSGALSYAVDGPKTLYGYVYGVADPNVDSAAYYLGVTHGVAPVPLPAAGWLLLSGLAFSVSLARRRAGPRAPQHCLG